MRDQYGRKIDYMRISITDRCNLRCRYCIPEGVDLDTMGDLLTYEEIETVVRCAVKLGITHVKITGGEPLVRRGAPSLIGKIKNISGIETVTLTTNGVYLKEKLDELIANRLDGVNVSLDTMDPVCYQKITGRDCFHQVMEGIEAAAARGIPTKINTVLVPEYNRDAWRNLIEYTKEYPVDVRFIEMMPIGYGARFGTVSNEELLKQIKKEYPGLKRDGKKHGNGPAVYYHIPGYAGSIGLISAIHGMFCEQCNRIRMNAQGQIKPCLCYNDTVDLRSVLRSPTNVLAETQESGQERFIAKAQERSESVDQKILAALKKAITMKPKQHCFNETGRVTEQGKMNAIGG